MPFIFVVYTARKPATLDLLIIQTAVDMKSPTPTCDLGPKIAPRCDLPKSPISCTKFGGRITKIFIFRKTEALKIAEVTTPYRWHDRGVQDTNGNRSHIVPNSSELVILTTNSEGTIRRWIERDRDWKLEKKFFFNQKIVNHWNGLSSNVVTAATVNSFNKKPTIRCD